MGRVIYRLLLPLGIASLVVASAPYVGLAQRIAAPAALHVQAGPVFTFPSNGQSFPLNGTMLFQVQPMSGAKGYLWSFVQGGAIMYQDLAWTGHLDGATYSIKKGSTAERRLHSGTMQVWVRAWMSGGQWSATSSVTVQLKGGPPSGPGTKPKSGPPAAGTVLYQANWSNGRDGWTLPQGWDTVSGELVNDGTNQDMSKVAQAPKNTSTTANYAVEAEIQMVRTTSSGCSGNDMESFGIALREDAKGYYPAGMVADYNGNWSSAIADQAWSNTCSATLLYNPLAKNSFSLDTGWHTYRAEVRGNGIRLLIDGNVAVETTDNHHLRGNAVGLWSFGVDINVRSFKVIAL